MFWNSKLNDDECRSCSLSGTSFGVDMCVLTHLCGTNYSFIKNYLGQIHSALSNETVLWKIPTAKPDMKTNKRFKLSSEQQLPECRTTFNTVTCRLSLWKHHTTRCVALAINVSSQGLYLKRLWEGLNLVLEWSTQTRLLRISFCET